MPTLKIAFTFAQMIAVGPELFKVTLPPDYGSLWDTLVKTDIDWLSVSLPVACYGDFKARLLITGLAPLVLVATMVAGCILWAVSSRALRSSRKLESGEIISATKDGLFRALPSTLLLSFVLVPAVSKKIFSSFDCVSYDFDSAKSTRCMI